VDTHGDSGRELDLGFVVTFLQDPVHIHRYVDKQTKNDAKEKTTTDLSVARYIITNRHEEWIVLGIPLCVMGRREKEGE
jgi:hypothetical protein